MSTIVKPLDIYIGDIKVFPDVNLNELNSPISNSDTYETMILTANAILESHICDIRQLIDIGATGYLIMPELDDTDDSPFHTGHDERPSNRLWYLESNDNQRILDLAFQPNAKWMNTAGEIIPRTFAGYGGKYITFRNDSILSPVSYTYKEATGNKQAGDVAITVYSLCDMFADAVYLEEIHNLNMTAAQYIDTETEFPVWGVTNEYTGDAWCPPKNISYRHMFYNCKKLTVLDAIWPSTLYSNNFTEMFAYCEKLPDNQFPTLNLASTNITAEGQLLDTINISGMFWGCKLVESTHITDASWTNVIYAQEAWMETKLSVIDIPATAAKLRNIKYILGDEVKGVKTDQGRDYSMSKYIIRTDAPINAYLNGDSDVDLTMFRYEDYNEDQRFLDTFGGIYVPDYTVQNWKDYISQWAPNVATYCVHGLSELPQS